MAKKCFLEIDAIFKNSIKLRLDDIIYEQKKCQIGSGTNQAALTLNRHLQETSLELIEFVKEGGLNNIECIEKISALEANESILKSLTAPTLPYFNSELPSVIEMLKVRAEYKMASFNLSEESLQHLPEYKSRVSLLRNWNYVGDHGDVQLKGKALAKIF
jgi:superfamily II RNA helicase